ncbi:hypothetical protein HDE_03867 [Halotydeus destructor]|nr:hypothetical protein HDE_03867 [Halotydeus destructor]
MLRIVLCLILVTWGVQSAPGPLVASIFDLLGAILHVLGRLSGQDQQPGDTSSGRQGGNTGTALIGGGYCDSGAAGDQQPVNDGLCAQGCKENKCDIYKNDVPAPSTGENSPNENLCLVYVGCIKNSGEEKDICQCGKPTGKTGYTAQFVISDTEDRMAAHTTPAGNC